ncbi:MAG: transposase family protein [Anaerolineae bacterium]|nr:transposase family protein [Anaerolineae bacterium]
MCQSLPVPIALSTYYNYRQLVKAHQSDRARIAMALHRSDYGKTPMDANTLHFMDTIIQRFYRSNPPLRKETVYHIAQQLWQHNRCWWLNVAENGAEGFDVLVEQLLDVRQEIDEALSDPARQPYLVQIQLPSRSWFYNYVRWFDSQPGPGAEIYKVRHGQAAWEDNFRIFDRFAETATLPLQYVFADHYKLDVLHVDDEYREVLSRLWLTLLIDAYSRAVLGLFLGYEDPCIESVQGALHHAIWPETGLDAFDITQPWACFGVPQRLFLDNAWAHHSHSLEDLARALADNNRYTAMEVVFRPPYQARYGGLVERLFGNLAGQLRERFAWCHSATRPTRLAQCQV